MIPQVDLQTVLLWYIFFVSRKASAELVLREELGRADLYEPADVKWTDLHEPADVMRTDLHEPADVMRTDLHEPAEVMRTDLHEPAEVMIRGKTSQVTSNTTWTTARNQLSEGALTSQTDTINHLVYLHNSIRHHRSVQNQPKTKENRKSNSNKTEKNSTIKSNNNNPHRSNKNMRSTKKKPKTPAKPKSKKRQKTKVSNPRPKPTSMITVTARKPRTRTTRKPKPRKTRKLKTRTTTPTIKVPSPIVPGDDAVNDHPTNTTVELKFEQICQQYFPNLSTTVSPEPPQFSNNREDKKMLFSLAQRMFPGLFRNGSNSSRTGDPKSGTRGGWDNHDGDLYCPTIQKLKKAETFMFNVRGERKEIVHFLEMDSFQFVHHGTCAHSSQQQCPGGCVQVNSIVYLIAFELTETFPFTFEPFEIPSYCSCKNIQG